MKRKIIVACLLLVSLSLSLSACIQDPTPAAMPAEVDYSKLLFGTLDQAPEDSILTSKEDVKQAIFDTRVRANTYPLHRKSIVLSVRFENGTLHNYIDTLSFLSYNDLYCPNDCEFWQRINVQIPIDELNVEDLTTLCQSGYVKYLEICFPGDRMFVT